MGPVVAVWGFSVLVGWIVGAAKGRGVAGFVLGLLLGVLGVIVVVCMRPTAVVEARRVEEIRAEGERLRGPGVPAEGVYRTGVTEGYAAGGGCGPGCSCV